MLVQVVRFVWAKSAYEHLGFVYASGVASGPTVGEERPRDDSEVVYADEIREMMLEPARQSMVQGESRGGKGSR